jgi:nucleolar complex protein 3
LITQLTVYKDIIPGYRIRPLTDLEKGAKVSKEVMQLRNFEDLILLNYKAYISTLVATIKASRKDESVAPLSIVAVSCAMSLLVSVPHFNFRTDLLKILVAQLSRRTQNEVFLKCLETLTTLFKEDDEGHASFEAVSMISKMAKARNYRLHPTVSPKFDFH